MLALALRLTPYAGLVVQPCNPTKWRPIKSPSSRGRTAELKCPATLVGADSDLLERWA